MQILNYILCFIMLAVIGIEIGFILVRNKRIENKGNDNFFLFTLVVLVLMLVFPVLEMATALEALRNILVLVAVFATMAVKRGFSAKGMEKLFFTIPWCKITDIHITAYQTSKICVSCKTETYTFKLYFSRYHLKKVLCVLQQYKNNIYLQECLHANVYTNSR